MQSMAKPGDRHLSGAPRLIFPRIQQTALRTGCLFFCGAVCGARLPCPWRPADFIPVQGRCGCFPAPAAHSVPLGRGGSRSPHYGRSPAGRAYQLPKAASGITKRQRITPLPFPVSGLLFTFSVPELPWPLPQCWQLSGRTAP